MDLKAKLGLHLHQKKSSGRTEAEQQRRSAETPQNAEEKASREEGVDRVFPVEECRETDGQVATESQSRADDSQSSDSQADQSDVSLAQPDLRKETLREKLIRISGGSSVTKKTSPARSDEVVDPDADFSSKNVLDFYDDDLDYYENWSDETSKATNSTCTTVDADPRPDGELSYEPLHPETHLTQLLPAQVVESELGEYVLVEYRYPVNHWHGSLPLQALIQEELAALCGVLKNEELVCPRGIEDLVFVDTETTGLAGGAGTFAFLVGVGYFAEGEFVLQQYLMDDYHQELAMLDALHQKLQGFSHLVTFNGKTFDWPLLKDRLTYHRMHGQYHPIHVDLLHPARRYYKERLANCRLGSLESSILGFTRTDDISGAEVPALFFNYLDEKDGRILLPVLQHNHWDILSLVTLLTHLVQVYSRPTQILVEPEDLFSAGKVYEDLGYYDQALDCYSICLERTDGMTFSQEVLKRISFLHKRLGQMEEASRIWWQFVEREENLRLFPYLELAKYLEHQLKDYQQALAVTRSGREMVLEHYQLFDRNKFKEILQQLEHREERLRRKLGKVGSEMRLDSASASSAESEAG